MKQFFIFLLMLVEFSLFAQKKSYNEKPPVFPDCETTTIDSLQLCFDNQVRKLIYNNFKVPKKVEDDKYKGELTVLFEVDTLGQFNVVYVDALYNELKAEVKRVFSVFPKVKPATFNGRSTYKQYNVPIKIPLVNPNPDSTNATVQRELSEIEKAAKQEFDNVNKGKRQFQNKQYSSQLNIQFTHSDYARFDRQMNLVGTNSHTASKPFVYQDIVPYYDYKKENDSLQIESRTWFERKLWNEHFVQFQADDYWFTVDPILDLQLGKDTAADFNSTYNNTRGILFQGGLGKKFNFYVSVFESQGRFAQYVNQYSESLKAWGPDPAIISGRGIAKRFKTNAYDYPAAEAYLSYAPIEYINLQFGHGKNFLGDGYRSLLMSDVTSPHPFLKLNTKFWKLKYTNTWMWLRDVRDDPTVTVDGAFMPKYIATHYLSLNLTKRLNIGLFESVIWKDSNNRGFDVNYLNPVIFYRAIEFQTGQDAGNAILGATAKYKFSDYVNMYGQFVLDEFSLTDIKAGENSWKNKYGYQLGLKYFNAFKVDNLLLQFEYNRIRPYTYSHNSIELNYANFNQPMAHLWGANFSEAIFIARYKYKRWFADMKLIYGERGLDFNDGVDNFSYGADVYRTYNDRPFDTGVEIGQGNNTKVFYGNLQIGYLLNTASNLKLFADVIYRDYNPDAVTTSVFKENTTWFTFGIRTDLFNWYFDY